MRSRLMLLALGLSALASPLAGQAKTIAGEWDAAMSTPGGVSMFKILFKVDSGNVTGIVKRPAGDVLLTGRVKGDSLRFMYTIDYNGNALELTITAIVAGDAMKGMVDMGGMAVDDFSAKRTPPTSGGPPLRHRKYARANAASARLAGSPSASRPASAPSRSEGSLFWLSLNFASRRR